MRYERELSDDAPSVQELLERNAKGYARRRRKQVSEQWFPVVIPEHQGLPFAVTFVGDMHLGNPGCNVPQLLQDLELIKDTQGMYGAFLGDGTDNWVGNLRRLYQDHEITRCDEMRMFRWALMESGVPWLFALLGNHDLWNDGEFMASALLDKSGLWLPKWEARVLIKCGRQSWKIHCAHDFKGHSQWNKLHGPLKAAMLSSDAELLVAGHRHTGGLQSTELPGTGRVVHVARARGYKELDDHALRHGYPDENFGSSVVAIFDPQARSEAQRVQLFYDLEQGAEYLTALRTYRAAKAAPKRPAKRKTTKPAQRTKKRARK